MRFLHYLIRRLIFFLPQVLGVMLITFLVVRAIPGDPARLMGGPLMPDEGVELIRQRMGLTGPLYLQFVYYVRNVCSGNLGWSWVTGNPVLTDIIMRLPGTLELILLALSVSFFILFPLALSSISLGKSFIKNASRRALFYYGMAAGALPDFWLALLLIFLFYARLHWAPSPVGQLMIGITAAARITGILPIDTLLAGDWAGFASSLAHLVLPVFVLAFVYGGAIVKIVIVSGTQLQKSDFVNFAKVSGLPRAMIQRYIRRSVYPPVATMSAITFGFLLGGAVLVETVFSWGGFGQYAVQSVIHADFAAIQGVVLVSTLLNLIVYILVDMIYFWVDPRIRKLG